jgi:hypothetical protein
LQQTAFIIKFKRGSHDLLGRCLTHKERENRISQLTKLATVFFNYFYEVGWSDRNARRERADHQPERGPSTA